MTTKEAAWRHPVHGRLVILPDGHTMTGVKALDQGWKIEDFPANVAKTATPHPHDKDKVIIARGATAERAKAIEAGFTINENVAVTGSENAEIARAHKAWRSSVLNLPEARDRESAAVEIITTQNADTMPVASARAFLRGLPTEQKEEAATPMTNTTDPRAARLAEIEQGARAFNTSRGYANKLKAAVSASSVDPVRLQRLADIRLAAITMRIEKGEMSLQNEQKKLAYAMSVHNQTGLPLATVFQQLGVDTSKMLA